MKIRAINRLLCVFLTGVLSVGSVSMPVFATENYAELTEANEMSYEAALVESAGNGTYAMEVEKENFSNVSLAMEEVEESKAEESKVEEVKEGTDAEVIEAEEIEEELVVEEIVYEEALASKDYSKTIDYKASDLNAITAIGDFEDTKGYWVTSLPPSNKYPARLKVTFCTGTVTVTGGTVEKQCDNSGARIIDGHFDDHPFTNMEGEIRGGTYEGGLYQKTIKGNDSPADWNQIIIDTGKTIKIGGPGLVITNGNVINNGTMDLSTVDLGECITPTGIFRSPTFVNLGHVFENNGLIILPAGADVTFIKGLKITGTGKIRIGSDEYPNDYDAIAESMLAFKSTLPNISSEKSNVRIYLNQPVAEIDLGQYVKGGTKPYTFEKTSGPDWVNISEDGVVSGIPTTLGERTSAGIKVTDKEGTEKTATIRISPCYKEERERISLIDVGSNISSVAYKDNAISTSSTVLFNNTTPIELRFNTENAKWQKKTGPNTYVDVTSGKFELGATYRLSNIEINNNNESLFGYEFDVSNLKVNMDGKPCEITSKRSHSGPNSYSYVYINSPDIVVAEKIFTGEGTIGNPWMGLQEDDYYDEIKVYIVDDMLFLDGGIELSRLKELQKPEDYPWYPYKNYVKHIIFRSRYVTNIPAYAFKGFTKIESLDCSSKITQVGDYAFEDCTALNSISFSNTKTYLGSGCFKGCKALTDVELPEEMVKFEKELFMGCSSLETIVVPNTVTTMGICNFEECSVLKNVTLSEKLKTIPNRTFAGCTSLEAIEIPKTVESIGIEAFLGCNKLKAIDLHQDVERTTGKINSNAFENCTALKEVNLGKYKSIGEYAFKSCTALENIVFPETVEFIGNNSFQYCSNLESITFEGNIEPGVGIMSAFSGLGSKNADDNPKAYFPMDWSYTMPNSSALWCGGYLDGEMAPSGELQGISITKAPTKISYKKGEIFDPAGMEIKAHYSDNTDFDVTSRCTFSPNLPLDVINNAITVSFTSKGITKTDTQTVYVVELQSIEVETAPAKTRYLEGEFFDPTGIKVIAHYTAGVNEEVTGFCTYSPTAALQKSDDKITVSYSDASETRTTEIPIKVFTDELLELSVVNEPDKTLYKEGEFFDTTGLKVVAYFGDETETDVTNICSYAPTLATPLTKNDTKVTVSYTKGMITKTVDISIEVANDFDIELSEYNDIYTGKAIKPAVTVRDNSLKYILKTTDYKVFYNNNVMPNAGAQIDSRVARFVTDETFVCNKVGIESFLAGKTPSELGAFDPALPYVVIQGIKNYSGATFINYNIKAVEVFNGNQPTAGTQIVIPEGFEVGKPAGVIKKFVANKKGLVFGKDYTFEIWQGMNLIVSAISGKAPAFNPETTGTYTLKIKCIHGYAGDYDTELHVAAKTELLSTAKVVIGANVKNVNFDASNNLNFAKNGNKIELANENIVFADAPTKDKNKIAVIVGGHYLTTNDFTVSYSNNAAVGTATVKLTPKTRTPYELANGAIQYAGIKTFTFSIKGTSLNAKKFTIDGMTSLPATTYDSKAWTLERLIGNSYVVENDGVVLTKDTHYKVSYINNVKKGTATVVFEGIPAGGYTGTIKKSIKINPLNIDVSMVTVDPQNWPSVSFTKMGGKLDNAIRLKLANGYKLNYGTDYTIRYANNKKWGADSYLIIDGKGNFKGSTGIIRFNTIKKNLADGYNDGTNYFGDRTISVKVDPIAFVNNAPTRRYSPKVYVYDGTTALAQKKEYTVTLINFDTATIQTYMNDRVANYAMRPQIKISAVDSATCGYSGELIIDVPIKEKQLTTFSAKDSKLEIALGDVRYNGNVVYVPVTVKYDNVLLAEGRDYTLQYGRSITGKGTVTVYGKGEYYGSVKKTFVIKGKNIK